MIKQNIQRAVSQLLIVAMTIQPVLANTFQYNVYVKGFLGGTTAPDKGVGEIDPGNEQNSGEQTPAPKLTLAPSSLTFDSHVGDGPSTKSTLLTNVGNADAKITGIKSDTNFKIETTCPDTLAPKASCTISATFEQVGQGNVSYSMSVMAPGAKSPVVLSMAAVNAAETQAHPILVARPSAVQIPELNPGELGTASSYLFNRGTVEAQLSGIVSSGHFAISSDCPAILAPQAGCTVTTEFSSYEPGPDGYTLAIRGEKNGTIEPMTFGASVIDNPAIAPKLTISPNLLRFKKDDATNSTKLTALLSNKGNAPANLRALPTLKNFAVTTDCQDSLSPGASCQVSASYSGSKSAVEVLPITAQSGAQTELVVQGDVPDTTSGVSLAFSPENLDFSGVSVGDAVSKTATLTNVGSANANFSSISLDWGASDFKQINDCPTALSVGASCTVTVSFKPVGLGDRLGGVSVSGNTGSLSQLPVRGMGLSAKLSAGVSTLKFGAVLLSQGSLSKAVTLTNVGNANLNGLAWTSSDSRINLASTTCGSSLAVDSSCQLNIGYTPSDYGTITGSVTVTSTDGGSAVIALSGVVVDAELAPVSLSFQKTAIALTASTQAVTLTNTGSAGIPIDGIGVWAGITDFNQSNNCGNNLAVGASCSISVAFTPSQTQTRTGLLSVISMGTTLGTVSLAGQGAITNLKVSAPSVSLANTKVGESSSVSRLVVSNPTENVVAIVGMGVSNNDSEFGQSNNCGQSLPSGGSCEVDLQAKPSVEGLRTGEWAVESDLGTISVPLAVLGTLPKGGLDGETPSASTGDGFTHYAIRFADTAYGASSAVRNVTFSNSGTGPLTVSSIKQMTGQGNFTFTDNCGATIAPGASCTIALTFSPTESGSLTGGIAIISDNGQFYLDLSGNTTAPIGTFTGTNNFGVVSVGLTAEQTIYLQNTGKIAAQGVVVSLEGEEFKLTSSTCGTAAKAITLAPAELCSVTVQYAPTMAGVSATAQLSVQQAFPTVPTYSLKGTSAAPIALFNTSPSGNFGTIALNKTQTQTFILANKGQVSLKLKKAPTVKNSAFAITDTTCTADKTLAAGATCTVTVGVTPTVVGALSDVLTATVVGADDVTLAMSADVFKPADSPSILLLHMDGSIEDSSTVHNSVATTGTGVSVSASPRFGSGALSVTNVSSGLVVKGADFSFPAGTDFTVEAFIYSTGSASFKQIVGQWGTKNAYQMALFSGVLAWQAPNTKTNGVAVSLNTWHHVAVSREGTTLRIFLDGAQVGSATDTTSYPYEPSIGMGVGKVAPQNNFAFTNGAIDEVRITKGLARYTGNFAVPTGPFED